MSMLRLLSNGQTLTGIGGRPNSYKLPAKAALPKFAPMNRPIALSPAIAQSKLPIQPSLFDAPQVAVPAPTPIPAAMQTSVSSATPKGPGISPWLRMGEMGKAFVRQVFLTPKQRPARPAVQTELALSKVTPVRNDLSDADLEVVSAKVGSVPPGSVHRNKAEAAGEAWTRKIVTRFSRRSNPGGPFAAATETPVAAKI